MNQPEFIQRRTQQLWEELEEAHLQLAQLRRLAWILAILLVVVAFFLGGSLASANFQ